MELTINPPNGRGCGDERDEGGLYACCGVGASGMPIEHFLLDPVRPKPWQRGYQIMEDSSGTAHLVNYIGVDGGKGGPGYPSAWSYVEETRGYGASRKLPRTILDNPDFYKLIPGVSRLVLVHPRALPLFGFGLNRKNKPLVGCKLFNHWKENRDHWEVVLSNRAYVGFVAGRHPKLMELPDGTQISPEPCTLALRDLSYYNHTSWGDNPDMKTLPAIEFDWPRFQVTNGSAAWSGNVPECGMDESDPKFTSAAFLSLPLHFEIPKADVHNIAGKVAQAGYEPVVTEW